MKMCGKEITAERRKSYCSEACYKKRKKEVRRKPKEYDEVTLKNKGVCTGCVYRSKLETHKYICNYLEIVGKSRVMVERENGGVKADSCICYKARKERNVTSSRHTEDRRAY